MNKTKFNIVFSNSISPSKWGGGEKWMVTAARELSLRGHNVVVAGRSGAIFLERADRAGLKTAKFNIHSDLDPLKVLKATRFFRREKTDICILNLNKDVRVAGFAARLAGVPVILARHGLELVSDRWKYRMTMKLVDGIITNSHSIREKYNALAWMPKDKTEVIYNGLEIPVDIDTIDLHGAYSVPEDQMIFGAAGRLDHQKGFDLLVQAAVQLRDKPFTFLIAGEGKQRAELQQLIDANRLQEKVKLIGFLENALPFLNSVDIVVQPSRYEGMPNTVLESMALGKPVLATEVNGVKELIKTGVNGISVPPESVRELTAGILKIAGHDDLDMLKRNGMNTIKTDYSVKKMTDHLESYFSQKYGSFRKYVPENGRRG